MKHLLLLGMAVAIIHVSQSSTPAFCQLPPSAGSGLEFIVAFYYNHTKDQCNPFMYNGEGGNSNRFENERQCIRNCSANVENIYPTDESLACHFKKAIGQCRGQILRYYYDSVHHKCKKFIWSGCIGNGNRFFDQGSCNATCAGIHDDGNDPEEDEPDTPIAIICGVLLGVIIAAFIIPVVVLTVRSKKMSSKKNEPGKSKEPRSDSPLEQQAIEMA